MKSKSCVFLFFCFSVLRRICELLSGVSARSSLEMSLGIFALKDLETAAS